MAATRGTVQGFTKDGRAQNGQLSRLGHGEMIARADTWRTFATAHVFSDGSGYIEVKRDGTELHRFDFGPEA